MGSPPGWPLCHDHAARRTSREVIHVTNCRVYLDAREAALIALASSHSRRVVIGNGQRLPPVGRSARASRMATVLKCLARHLTPHANASDEVEPVSLCLQIKDHHIALFANNKSPGSLGTPGPSNGAKFLCKRVTPALSVLHVKDRLSFAVQPRPALRCR
jgi:hypothetical protein